LFEAMLKMGMALEFIVEMMELIFQDARWLWFTWVEPLSDHSR
jgi:hypothetical protein